MFTKNNKTPEREDEQPADLNQHTMEPLNKSHTDIEQLMAVGFRLSIENLEGDVSQDEGDRDNLKF